MSLPQLMEVQQYTVTRLVMRYIGSMVVVGIVAAPLWAQIDINPPTVPNVSDLAPDVAPIDTNVNADATNIELGNIRVNNTNAREATTRIGRLLGRNRAAELGLSVMPEGRGLVVAGLDADGVVAGAGLQEGDKILAVNKTWVRSPDQLTTQLRTAAQTEGRAWLYVDHEGDRHWVNLDFSGRGQGAWGILANRQDDQLRVQYVNPRSAAATAGLKTGDHILMVNGVRVVSGRELDGRLRAAARGNGEATIRVMRNNQPEDLVARLHGTAESTETAGGLVNARLRRLQRRLDTMISNENDTSTRRLERIRANTEDLRARLAESADEQRRGEVGEAIRERLTAIRTDLSELANESNADRRFDLDELVSLAIDLQQRISAMVNTNTGNEPDRTETPVSTAADVEGRVREQAEEIVNALTEIAQNSTGDLQARVTKIRDRASELRDNLTATMNERLEQFDERLEHARDTVADLYRSVDELASQSSGNVQDQLLKVRNDLGKLRSELSDYAREAVSTASQRFFNASEEISDRAQRALTRVEILSDRIRSTTAEASKERLGKIRGEVDQLGNQIRALVEDSQDATSDAVVKSRDTATSIATELKDIAANASGEARQQIDALQNTAEDLRAELEALVDATNNLVGKNREADDNRQER